MSDDKLIVYPCPPPPRTNDGPALPPGDLIRASVAAKRLGRDARTIRAWVASGTLAGKRIGKRWYVYRGALLAILDVPIP